MCWKILVLVDDTGLAEHPRSMTELVSTAERRRNGVLAAVTLLVRVGVAASFQPQHLVEVFIAQRDERPQRVILDLMC